MTDESYLAIYLPLAYAHLATVIPAAILGTYLLFAHKGTPIHKLLGKIYMVLMLMTASITIFMPSLTGFSLFGHFGFIHLFSLLVFFTVPSAYKHAKAGNIKAHRSAMVGMYVGAILIAGALAFTPGRLLHTWLFT
jgi:uncharacterized membrane protein